MQTTLARGNLVRWVNGSPGNTAVVTEASNTMATIVLDSREKMSFALPTDMLQRLLFKPGDRVEVSASHEIAVVTSVVQTEPLAIYELGLGSSTSRMEESGLRPAKITDPIELIRRGELHDSRSTNLRITATRLQFDHRYNEFSSLSNSRLEIKTHQVGVLHRVASSYPHRFLLADEVGLGKTIEAGLIIKELKARGIADRVLILAPSGIVGQWQMEMRSKFGLAFALYNREQVKSLQLRNPGEDVWTLEPNVITSTSFAAHDEARREGISSVHWDLVVIDEAHHARRRLESEAQHRWYETNLYKLAKHLAGHDVGATGGLLLLTATPMQIDRSELYSLLELLDPVLYADLHEFDDDQVARRGLNTLVKSLQEWNDRGGAERRSVATECARWLRKGSRGMMAMLDSPEGRERMTEELLDRHRLSDVLIRNRKCIVGGFNSRVASIWPVEMTESEREAYVAVTDYVRYGYAAASRSNNVILGFLMTIFQKLNSSSTYALRKSLERRVVKLREKVDVLADDEEIDERDLEEKPIDEAMGLRIAALEGRSAKSEIQELARILGLLDSIEVDSKVSALVKGLEGILSHDPQAKVLIFTQFRDTQQYIRGHIPASWEVHVYHGQLTPSEKDSAVSAFRDGHGPQILLSTEAGGEGRNFQFCHMLINYDLPWNPMKVEQRIGRLDRIGQGETVKIINFKLVGTIEERVLDVLTYRIKVFEETIGGLDPILGDVENEIRRIYERAAEEAEHAVSRLGKDLQRRVERARAAERQLADLIVDAKSFRQDEVKLLLERRGTLDNRAMQRFVLGALEELDVKIEEDATLDGVFVLRRFYKLLGELPQFARAELPGRVTFDPSVAVDYESIDFLAFGHKLVETLVDRVQSKSYQGSTSRRLIRANDQWPASGWLFVYVLGFEGVSPRKELLPIFVHGDGTSDDDLAIWILERCYLEEREERGRSVCPKVKEDFERVVTVAGERALEQMTRRRDELAVGNSEKLEQQRAKMERIFQHRLKAAAAKLASVQATFDRVTNSEEPNDQRIAPVWRKNLENARKQGEQIEKDKDRVFRDLDGHREVSGRLELLALSFVEIEPEQA